MWWKGYESSKMVSSQLRAIAIYNEIQKQKAEVGKRLHFLNTTAALPNNFIRSGNGHSDNGGNECHPMLALPPLLIVCRYRILLIA